MRNPHRVYETNFHANTVRANGRNPFFEDYTFFVDDALSNPRGETDPRKIAGMDPEPYRHHDEVIGDKRALKKYATDMVTPNIDKWEWLYETLSDKDSRQLLVAVVAYRALGWNYVRLPLHNEEFFRTINELEELSSNTDVPQHVKDKGMTRFHLRSIGKDIDIFSDAFGVFNEFVYPQYSYRGYHKVFTAEPGDYVLDCGACYGGTTLNFAHDVGPEGRVYSFEFMPENAAVYRSNVHANINLLTRVCLIERPVYSQSDLTMSITGKGPATQVHFAEIEGAEKVQSIKLDDFVAASGLPKVNLIKMDIEGAEIEALKGAAATIERFKPKMAICVYHNLSDFYEVPRFLKGIRDDYKIYFGHSTTHGDESVIFAV
ncbi:FkbM family methyltransferase [Agrobacterium vitis]|nr:FkbM family methyltransferase [Agrobacterium vitis]MBE1437091.1 FkbM family methyltransferase [Agrobacterium vitis]